MTKEELIKNLHDRIKVVKTMIKYESEADKQAYQRGKLSAYESLLRMMEQND